MLSMLHLRDFALVDSLTLEFHEGLNVLSGETGAGKSILIGAIGLILGERSSSEQIRSGAEQALVEGVFHCNQNDTQALALLENYGINPGDELIFSRQISRHGRNICRINGRPVPLSALKEIGGMLVDLHGQHSQHSLLNTEHHLLLLDEFGGGALIQARLAYGEAYNRLKELQRQLSSLGHNEGERERTLDLLRYQRNEIEAAALDENEEESLRRRLSLLDNTEKLLSMANMAYNQIYEGLSDAPPVVDTLNNIHTEMAGLQGVDPELEKFSAVIEEAAANLSELGHDLYAYRESLEFYPEEREELETRLETYKKIKKKYGSSIAEVLSFAQACSKEIELLENSAGEALRLEKETALQQQKVKDLSLQLTDLRKEAAAMLEQEIIAVVQELGMQDAVFSVAFTEQENPGRSGGDTVEFLFSSNRGEPVKSLSRIISAGEMARVMLAVKSILAAQDRIPTMIFDEIDSGIGGVTIQKVAEKMGKLGLNHQVICVTHSSQIASAADHHFFIFKEVSEERTCTRVRYLDEEERIGEVARLLDGRSDDDVSRRHARELLKNQKTGDRIQKTE